MGTAALHDQGASSGGHTHEVPILIDDHEFKVPEGSITGATLRSLPTPPVPTERDLWLEVPGPTDDIKVQPTDTITVKAGMHFYTAPATINPGSR